MKDKFCASLDLYYLCSELEFIFVEFASNFKKKMKKLFPFLGKTCLLIVLIAVATLTVRGNNESARKDSLRSLISTLDGKERLNVYEELSLIYFVEVSNLETIDSLLAVYDEIFSLAAELNDTIVQSRVKTNIIVAYLNINELDKVIELAPEHLAFIEKFEVWEHFYSIVYRSYANAWLRKGDSEKSILIAREMYEHAHARNNIEGMAAAYAQIAVAYERTSRMEDAEAYTRQAIDLLKNNEKMPDILPTYYFRLGNILRLQGRYDDALQVARDCEKSVETLQKQWTRTLPPTFWVNTWSLYSSVYAAMRDFDKSEAYLDKIDSLNVGSPIISKNSFRNRARALEERGEYDKALEFIDKACAIPPYLEDPTSNALYIKSFILAHMGRIDEARLCIEEMTAINDSLRHIDFNRQLDELRVAHEVDILTAEKELRLRQLFLALAVCAMLIVALSIWIFFSHRLKKKNIILAKRILEQTKLYDATKILQDGSGQQMHRITNPPLQTSYDDNKSDDTSKDVATTAENALFEQLELYMNEKKPFIDPNLNRKNLSEVLFTNEKYLREIIKNKTGATVNDYIISYRLRYANILLLKPDNEYTIETIALESGFGSRASFYACYSTNFGLSPSEYRKIINRSRREE